MNQQEVIAAFKKIMPEIQKSKDPEGSLLKYAEDKNLTPALLEKLAQTFNTAKTLKVFKTASSDVDRGRTFKLIDVPDLLRRYTGGKEKAAARGFSDDALGWLEEDERTKSASEGVYLDRAPDLVSEALGISRYEIEDEPEQTKAASSPGRTPLNVVLHELDIIDGAIEDQRIRLDGLFSRYKEAASRNPNLAREILQDMRAAKGDEVEWPLRKFASWLRANRTPQNRILEPDTRPLAEDRHKAASWMDEVLDAVETIRALASYGRNMAKAANAVEWDKAMASTERAWNNESLEDSEENLIDGSEEIDGGGYREISWGTPPQEKTLDYAEPSEPSEPSEEKGDKDKSDKKDSPRKSKKPSRLLSEAPSPGRRIDPGALADSGLSRLISGQADKLYRNQVVADRAVDDLRAATNLQQLLLGNEVLRGADRKMVVDLFNSIRKANPDIARDKNLLEMALMEATEHRGIPLHMYSQLLDTREKAKPRDSSGGKSSMPNINVSLV